MEATGRGRGPRALRVALVVVLFAALVVVGKVSGLASKITVDRLRELTAGAGVLGVAAYVAAFSAGQLIHVPGLLFVTAALLAWGKVWGAAIALAGALVSLSVTFFLARSIGGNALAEIETPWVRRLFTRIEARPVMTVFLLRVCFTTWPTLNYALALSGIRYRDYLLGSALALAPFVVLAGLALDRLLLWLG